MIGRWCNRKVESQVMFFFTFSSSFMLVVAIYKKAKAKRDWQTSFHENFRQYIKVYYQSHSKIEITQ